jgi:hypothetical protein
MDDAAGGGLIDESRRMRREGLLDEAVSLLTAEGDLADPKTAYEHLLCIVERDDPRSIQHELYEAIRRLETARAPPEPDYLSYLTRQCEFACLETPVLETLLAMAATAPSQNQKVLMARKGLARRIGFRREVLAGWDGHATLLTLGLYCMPWDLLNTWGFRRPDEYVSLFTPFAHGVHRYRAVANALGSDFGHYCRLDQLHAVETVGGHFAPARTDAQVIWNHHRTGYWIENDFERLRQNLALKIDAFRLACRQPDAVFVMGKAPVHYPEEPIHFLADLNAALEKFTGSTRNRIFFVDEHSGADARLEVDDRTFLLNTQVPGGGATWYDPDAEDGLAFEQTVATALLASLSDWGLMHARA